MDESHRQIRDHSHSEVVEPLADLEGATTSLDRQFWLAQHAVMLSQIARDPTEPALVAELRRDAFGLAQALDNSAEVAERLKRVAEREPQVDCLLDRVPRLGHVLEHADGLLEERRRLAVRALIARLRAGEHQV